VNRLGIIGSTPARIVHAAHTTGKIRTCAALYRTYLCHKSSIASELVIL
jgi:hypothetical protein